MNKDEIMEIIFDESGLYPCENYQLDDGTKIMWDDGFFTFDSRYLLVIDPNRKTTKYKISLSVKKCKERK